MAVALESRVDQNPEVVSTEVNDCAMLMSIESGRYFAFNPVGSRIWKLLAKPARLKDVCDALVAEFEVSPSKCRDEVVRFVEKLVERELVRVEE
jgi:hypothetical protein